MDARIDAILDFQRDQNYSSELRELRWKFRIFDEYYIRSDWIAIGHRTNNEFNSM